LEKISGVTLKNEYQYSDTSIIEGVKLNGSQILTYDWDDLIRMTSRTLNLAAPFTTQYTYLKGSNAGGETTLVAEIKNGGETLSYTYDQFGNIVSVSKNGTVVESYEYDGLNQLTKVTNGANVTEYAYDAGGNLASVKLNGTVTDSYGYTDADWKDLLTSFNGQSITYDEIGNPLTYRDGFTFTWQHGRRLSSISHNGDSISYIYDPDGIRTSKVVNNSVTKFHIMNGTLLGQTKDSDTIVFLYDEKANKYGFDYNGTKYYYIFNVQGDVIGILNQSGAQIVSYQYDPWGKVLSVSGSEAASIGQINPIRYRGYYYDTETGFYYLQSRYYDPITRRFLNADTAINAEGTPLEYNLFAYCLNNPVRYTDPTGYNPLILVAIAVPALFVAASASSLLVLAQALPTDIHIPEVIYQRIEMMQQNTAVTFAFLLYPVYAAVNPVAVANARAQAKEKAASKEATITTTPKPRNPNDLHHIVPKALDDWRIDYARLRMEIVDIKLNNPVNLISLPRAFHSRMHGNNYRDLVYDVFWRNTCGWNYSTSFQEKRSDVLMSLSYLRTRIIIACSANDPYGW
jgi:RHS repeat-associated protein